MLIRVCVIVIVSPTEAAGELSDSFSSKWASTSTRGIPELPQPTRNTKAAAKVLIADLILPRVRDLSLFPCVGREFIGINFGSAVVVVSLG